MALFTTKKSFLKAAAAGDLDGVRRGLAKGYDPNTADKKGVSALAHAARNGRLPALRLLLEKKPDLERTDARGYTPLMAAAWKQQTEAAGLLLAAGANPDAHDKNYCSALGQAAFDGNIELLRLMLGAKANPDVVIGTNGRTPLHWAVDHQYTQIVEELMRAGARSDIADRNGETAFDIARGKSAVLLKQMEAMRAASAAAQAPQGWLLTGPSTVAHDTVSAPLGRRITEIFNFGTRERLIITQNLATQTETQGQPERFDTLAPDLVQQAEARLTALGGTAPPKKSLEL